MKRPKDSTAPVEIPLGEQCLHPSTAELALLATVLLATAKIEDYREAASTALQIWKETNEVLRQDKLHWQNSAGNFKTEQDRLIWEECASLVSRFQSKDSTLEEAARLLFPNERSSLAKLKEFLKKEGFGEHPSERVDIAQFYTWAQRLIATRNEEQAQVLSKKMSKVRRSAKNDQKAQ